MKNQDKCNFLAYQYDSSDAVKGVKNIPPKQKPSPKKLKDAISKRKDSPARRYMKMINP